MQTIDHQEILELVDNPAPPCVSIFMPAHRAGPDTRQDPIRLKNLIKEAGELLAHRYPDGPAPEELLGEAQSLVDDHQFWQRQQDGLAIFSSPEETTVKRLPYRFESQVSVGENYDIVPLLPLLVREGFFYLLAIDLGGSQLYEGSQLGLREVDMPETPLSLEAALRFDDPEAQLQFHTRTSSAHGDRDAMYFGTGAGEGDDLHNAQRFLQQLAAGVQSAVGIEANPLVLAGVDHLVAAYREANRYPHLLEAFVAGSPGSKPPETLHQEAWDIVEPVFTAEKDFALKRYQNLRVTSSVTAHLDEIVPAASRGQVDTLFLQSGMRVWGDYDPESQAVAVHPEQQPGSRDLLGLAARETLAKRGMVYLLEAERMPARANAAAILRYPLERA